MQKPDAINVAKYIIEHQSDISFLKLNELLYYCQAWNEALFKKPLFNNQIKIKKQKLYIPNLYQIYLKHQHDFNHYLLHAVHNYKFISNQKAVMDGVLKSYGQDDGIVLLDRIHQERPWLNAKNVIKLSDMLKYYSKLVKN